MDMGGLQNIVANSAYVSARGSVDGMAASTMRDKKFRAKLNLPHIKKSEHMKTTVNSGFDSMCVKQPVGKRLFQQYLERDATHKNACKLWKDIEISTSPRRSTGCRRPRRSSTSSTNSSPRSFAASWRRRL